MSRPIFITGTDTGVGKTVFTALLARHLCSLEVNVKVLKPFCSGGREDVEILAEACGFKGDQNEINPYFFSEPIAPFLAAKSAGKSITITDCLAKIDAFGLNADCSLIEGAGGLLSPLGEGFDLLTLAQRMGGEVILVAPNKIGVINQVLLNVNELLRSGVQLHCIVLMGIERPDPSVTTNADMIREMTNRISVFELSWLGDDPVATSSLKKSYESCKKVLAAIVPPPYFPPPFDGKASSEAG